MIVPSLSVDPLPSNEQERPVQPADAAATGAALDRPPGPRKTDRARQSMPSTVGPDTTVGVPLSVPGAETVPGVNATRSRAPEELSTKYRFPPPRKAPLTWG